MSSSAKQQETRRRELQLTARERLATEEAQRIKLLLQQIRDSSKEIHSILPEWARKTILAFSEVQGTKGLVSRLDHDDEYGCWERFMAILDRLEEKGEWR